MANAKRTKRHTKINIRATEHAGAREAIRHLAVTSDHRAILIGADGGRRVQYLTLARLEAERLEAAGVEFAYLSLYKPTDQIMTIPVNDR